MKKRKKFKCPFCRHLIDCVLVEPSKLRVVNLNGNKLVGDVETITGSLYRCVVCGMNLTHRLEV